MTHLVRKVPMPTKQETHRITRRVVKAIDGGHPMSTLGALTAIYANLVKQLYKDNATVALMHLFNAMTEVMNSKVETPDDVPVPPAETQH